MKTGIKTKIAVLATTLLVMFAMTPLVAFGEETPAGGNRSVNYDLWIGGEQVTSENLSGKGNDGDKGTWRFTPAQGDDPATLTLNNYHYKSTATAIDDKTYYVIKSNIDGLVIRLAGNSTIKSTTPINHTTGIYTSKSLEITDDPRTSGDGSLDLSVVPENTATTITGIYINTGDYNGELRISGGTVTVHAEGNGLSKKSHGIYANIVTVDGGTLDASGTGGYGSEDNIGIFISKSLTIGENASVVVSGGNSAVYGKVNNAQLGAGWSDVGGTENEDTISVSSEARSLQYDDGSSYKKLMFPAPQHEHDFTYTVGDNGNSITAKCKYACQYMADPITLTLNKPVSSGSEGLIYDSTAKEVSLDGYPDNVPKNLAEKPVIKYYLSTGPGSTVTSGSQLTGAPVNAGDYVAQIEWGGKTASTAFSIAKASLTITVNDQNYPYNGKQQGEGDPAYDDPAVIKQKVTAPGLQGSDYISMIVLTGTATDIGVYPDHIEITGFDITNAANVSVKDNYDTTLVAGTLTITPGNVTISTPPTAAAITYGQTLASSTLTGGKAEADGTTVEGTFTWTNKTIRPEVKDSNKTTYSVTFTPADTHNYASTTTEVTLPVNKASITITADDKSSSCGDALQKLTYKVSGAYVKGDDLGVKLSTDANKDTAGTYSIKTAWNGNPNYNATLVNGKYTVTAGNTILLPTMTAKDKTSMTVEWEKTAGAEGYDVFFGSCRSNKKLRLAETIRDPNKTSWTKDGLKGETAYRARVKAWIMKDGKKTYVKSSPTVHAYTSGGTETRTNAKSVSVKKDSFTLKKGKAAKIRASVRRLKAGRKLMPKSHVAKFRYLTTDKKVATVSKKGKIKAVGKGTCCIYVFAHNGKYKKVNVTVK